MANGKWLRHIKAIDMANGKWLRHIKAIDMANGFAISKP
jgi:hypothetical protein